MWRASTASMCASRWRPAAHEVTLILAVPSINSALRDELDDLGLTLPPSHTGYHYITDALLPLVVIDLRAVAERDDDDVLRCFAGLPLHTVEARRWVGQHWSTEGKPMSTHATPDLYGYDEFIDRLNQELTPAQRLRGLTPAQRLEGLAPAERLEGLSVGEAILALPVEALRGLTDAFLATLPDEVQAAVRARRGH